MKEYIKERTLKAAQYISDTHQTIREAAKVFYISKSTVHHDLSTRLKNLDSQMFEQVQKILDENFDEKHIRGGQATKHKYENERSK